MSLYYSYELLLHTYCKMYVWWKYFFCIYFPLITLCHFVIFLSLLFYPLACNIMKKFYFASKNIWCGKLKSSKAKKPTERSNGTLCVYRYEVKKATSSLYGQPLHFLKPEGVIHPCLGLRGGGGVWHTDRVLFIRWAKIKFRISNSSQLRGFY